MFSTRDEPGVLFNLLRPLAEHKINLTKIESRPLKKRAWEYVFFIDLDGHQEDPQIAEVLRHMTKECSFMQVLGSYPREISK
jgi:chorismate mutase/prephenate dehydratase